MRSGGAPLGTSIRRPVLLRGEPAPLLMGVRGPGVGVRDRERPGEREREREVGRDREKERETETDRQRDVVNVSQRCQGEGGRL